MPQISDKSVLIKKEFQSSIEGIMAEFNFTKVSIIMNLLQWKWRGEIPDEERIKQTAEGLLIDLCNDGAISCNSGGFEADWDDDEQGDKILRLRFIPEECTIYVDYRHR